MSERREAGIPPSSERGLDATAPDLSDATAAMRAEWRAEEEDYTAAAHQQWQHGLTFFDRARGWMHRGDQIEVIVGEQIFRGSVVATGPDLLTLRTPSGRVDISLGNGSQRTALTVRTVLDAGGSGQGVATNPAGAVDFRARLGELETAGRRVELGITPAPGSVRGVLILGADHVVARDDDVQHTVPLAHVLWVRMAD